MSSSFASIRNLLAELRYKDWCATRVPVLALPGYKSNDTSYTGSVEQRTGVYKDGGDQGATWGCHRPRLQGDFHL